MELSEVHKAAVIAVLDAVAPASAREAGLLSEAALADAQSIVAQIRRLVEVRDAVLAGEVAKRSDAAGGGMARKHGHRNAVGMVAGAHGGGTREARDLIAVGSLLADCENGTGASWPALAGALTAGEVSAAQAALVKDTLDALEGADTDLEARLLAKARRLSLADLTKVCADVKARWDIGQLEAREKRQRAERYLALTEGVDGMVTLHGRLDPASAAPVMTWLDATVRAEFSRKRDAGEGPALPGEAGRIRVDALVDLIRHGMRCDAPGSGSSTTVVVRIDTESLRTGLGLGSCDALGVPFTAGQIRRLAVDAQILPLMLGTGSQALDVGYAKRFFTPAQKTALAERDGGCAFCHRPVAWADTHHITDWALDGPSNLSNGALLCTRCHHRIHDDGWTIHATATEIRFIPPAPIDPTRTPRLGGKAALRVELPASAHPPL